MAAAPRRLRRIRRRPRRRRRRGGVRVAPCTLRWSALGAANSVRPALSAIAGDRTFLNYRPTAALRQARVPRHRPGTVAGRRHSAALHGSRWQDTHRPGGPDQSRREHTGVT